MRRRSRKWSPVKPSRALACGFCALLGTSSAAAFTRGDADGDDAVRMADVSFILDSLFGLERGASCEDAADANDDGEVDISDAVYLLDFLFAGGAAPPLPSPGAPCGGPDPTGDGLDCRREASLSRGRPRAGLAVVFASPPGVRQRSRRTLPEVSPGVFRVDEGASFSLVVAAEADTLFRAPVRLLDPREPTKVDARILSVVTDRDLGDAVRGGVSAGSNLAPWFLGDLDPWSDPLYLVEHVALRVTGSGPLAPAPGTYTFSATVTDSECGVSEPAVATLEVVPSFAPDVLAWVEANPALSLLPLPHHAGSGSPRVTRQDGVLVVVEALPNGRHPGRLPDPATLEVLAGHPAEAARAITHRFERDPGAIARWSLWLEPGGELLTPGNTELTISVASQPSAPAGRFSMVVEVELSHQDDVRTIFDRNCSGCHEGPGASNGLVLVAPGEPAAGLWRRIVNVFAAQPVITSNAALLVRPYFPERSYIYHKLAGTHLDPDVGGDGARMPFDGPPYLDAHSMRIVRDWIVQGASR